VAGPRGERPHVNHPTTFSHNLLRPLGYFPFGLLAATGKERVGRAVQDAHHHWLGQAHQRTPHIDAVFHTDCKNTLFFSKLQIFAEQLLKTACKGTNKRAENKRKYEVIYFAFPSESTFDEVRGTNKRAESKAKTLFF
jgi:hypothetical protein